MVDLCFLAGVKAIVWLWRTRSQGVDVNREHARVLQLHHASPLECGRARMIRRKKKIYAVLPEEKCKRKRGCLVRMRGVHSHDLESSCDSFFKSLSKRQVVKSCLIWRVIKTTCKYMVTTCDLAFENVGRLTAFTFYLCQKAPQYKYIIRPIYRSIVPIAGRPAASVCTAILTNVLCHQILIVPMPTGNGRVEFVSLCGGAEDFLLWTCLGFATAYFKYKNPDCRNMFPWLQFRRYSLSGRYSFLHEILPNDVKPAGQEKSYF